MGSELVKRAGTSIVQSKSTSGAVGKGMVAAGGGAIALSVVAAFIPFVGVFGLGFILILLGMFMAE